MLTTDQWEQQVRQLRAAGHATPLSAETAHQLRDMCITSPGCAGVTACKPQGTLEVVWERPVIPCVTERVMWVKITPYGRILHAWRTSGRFRNVDFATATEIITSLRDTDFEPGMPVRAHHRRHAA